MPSRNAQLTSTCPGCELEVAEACEFCPRCAKPIWPHIRKAFSARLKRITWALVLPTLAGGVLGAIAGGIAGVELAAFGAMAGLLLGGFIRIVRHFLDF